MRQEVILGGPRRAIIRSSPQTWREITSGAKNKAKLSAAQLALVTDKGWTLG